MVAPGAPIAKPPSHMGRAKVTAYFVAPLWEGGCAICGHDRSLAQALGIKSGTAPAFARPTRSPQGDPAKRGLPPGVDGRFQGMVSDGRRHPGGSLDRA